MAKDYEAMTKDISEYVKKLSAAAPDTINTFYTMAKAASADGVLDKKTKELIALAIGVATHCDGCIAFHAKTLRKLGATEQEIVETMAMCVYMGGGPSLMYAADALRAFDQFGGE